MEEKEVHKKNMHVTYIIYRIKMNPMISQSSYNREMSIRARPS